MARIISILALLLVFLVILVVGVQFSSVNSEPVTVNYLLGTLSLPLSFVVVSAFALGVLVTLIVSFGIVLPLRWRVSRLQRQVDRKEHELGRLRRRAAAEAG